MVNFALAILLLFYTFDVSAQFDASSQSGILNTSTGTVYRHSLSNPALLESIIGQTQKTLNVTEGLNVPTSKGTFRVDLPRSALVDVARIGKIVAGYARLSPPIALSLTSVTLICQLSNICDVGGVWKVASSDPLPGQADSYPVLSGKYNGWAQTNGQMNYYSTPATACADPRRISQNVGPTTSYRYLRNDATANPSVFNCFATHITNGGSFSSSNTTKASGCADGYTLSGVDCLKTGLVASHDATGSDWDSKESTLNDNGFLPDMLAGGKDIPINVPTITTPFNKPLGIETTTLKDGSGTVTGSETKETNLQLTSPSTPNASQPNIINLTETTTITTYNNNNQVTNISTTSSTPVQSVSDPITINFDTVNNTALGEKIVTAPFTITSWGAGECPPDIDFSLSSGEQSIDSQPFCDFAISLKPVLLLIASLAAAYIVITSTRPTT